jgi:hypothetical protein
MWWQCCQWKLGSWGLDRTGSYAGPDCWFPYRWNNPQRLVVLWEVTVHSDVSCISMISDAPFTSVWFPRQNNLRDFPSPRDLTSVAAPAVPQRTEVPNST